MPTIDDIRKSDLEMFGHLSDESVVRVLQQTEYPDMSEEELGKRLGIKPPPVPKLKRTWGEAVTDNARSHTSGVVGLAKFGGDMWGLGTGNMDNQVSRIAGGMQETIADEQSPALKEKRADRKTRINAADGELAKLGTAFKETVTDPALMGDMIASNLATMLPGMAAGRAVMGAGAAARRTMTEAAALLAAQKAAKGATGAAVGVGALQQGADVSSQAYDDSIKKTAAQLAQNPVFVARVDAGEAPKAVAMSMGLDAARAAFLPAFAISVGANTFIPGGTMLERALIGGAAKDTIKAGTKYAMPKAMLKAGLGEAAQETVEEGGGQFAANVAKKRFVDPNQDLGQDVGENAGMGAAGGLGLGVAGGMMHREHTPAALPLLPPNGPMARAVNRGIVAEAGMPPPAAPPSPVVLAPEVEADLLAHANDRAAEIDLKAKGKKGQKTTDQNGKPVTTPDQQPEFLTPQEKAERDFLTEHGGDVQALSRAYPGMVDEPAVPTPAPEPAAPPAPAAEAPKPTELPAAPDAAPKPAEAPAYAVPAAEAATEPADQGQPIEIDGKKWRAKARPGGGYLLTDGAGGTRAVAGTAKAAQRIADLLADYPDLRKTATPNADHAAAAPEAESQAPARSADGDGGVAPTQGSSGTAPNAAGGAVEADGLKAVPALPAEPSQTSATKNQGGAATAKTINAKGGSETAAGQPAAATLQPTQRADAKPTAEPARVEAPAPSAAAPAPAAAAPTGPASVEGGGLKQKAISAADHAVDRADATGLKGADRKDAVAQDLSQAWGMTVDEVRDADEFKQAVSKPPRKAARTKATERFVDGVVQQAMQAHAAQQAPEAAPATNKESLTVAPPVPTEARSKAEIGADITDATKRMAAANKRRNDQNLPNEERAQAAAEHDAAMDEIDGLVAEAKQSKLAPASKGGVQSAPTPASTAAPQETQPTPGALRADAGPRPVTMKVRVEDTGQEATMTMDGPQTIAEYDDRISNVEKLIGCLRGKR